MPTDVLSLPPIEIKSLSEQATDRLRLAILGGLLKPGAPLVERDLARQMGVSRVPVREAIQRLSEEGLVKRAANRGATVYLPSLTEIEEITSIRILLEQFVAERVILLWDQAGEAALAGVVASMREGVRLKDRRTLANLDTEFHNLTWHMAGHMVLMEVVSSLRQRVAHLLNETIGLMSEQALPGIIESHERLIAVFRSGDVGAAREEISRHIESGKDRIIAAHKDLAQ